VVLNGPGVEGQLFGLYMGRDRQEVDNHTSILHAHPNCSTREVYKGILDGASHAVFNGKVYVTPEAQKTDAKQTNRNLLLSERARVDTKPQLEIFADDVKCTHGATVGSLDAQAEFYLKSRGIGPVLGRRILTYAFAAEVLEEMPYPEVRSGLEGLVSARLEIGVAA
jgi:Fe-S cluster assembly protein SufD